MRLVVKVKLASSQLGEKDWIADVFQQVATAAEARVATSRVATAVEATPVAVARVATAVPLSTKC